MAVRYFEQQVNSKLKNKRRLSSFLQSLIQKHRDDLKTIDLTYIFCNDNYLVEINQKFLNHDTLTDIITFDLSENEDDLVSEIYISIDRIKENAEKFKVQYEQELHRVIFHGALHLCGFKDKTSIAKEKMRQQEDSCLQQYFAT
ncbi:MAG TPA: rRNA maturation RNase YbeY [Flavipsychrobacter sp.]|nr:rRNA maturation RNase YbeY [Flavipsychrobacter sp.]